MSITKKQQPTKKIVGIYNNYFTSISSDYTNEGYFFKYEIDIPLETLSTSYIYPHMTGGLGIFNPSIYIKNLFTDIDLDVKQISWDTCDNSIYNFRVDVSDDTDSENFTKLDCIKTYEEDFDYTNFMLNKNTKKFLTHYHSTRNLSLNSYDVLRFFSGKIGTIYSYAYEVRIDLKRNGYIYTYKSLNTNPYYSQTISGENASNLILENKGKYLMTFGTGPKNIQDIMWKYIKVVTPGGIILNGSGLPVTLNLNVGDEYDVYMYYSGEVSERITYKIVCEDEIQLFWENRYGGFDTHIFNKNHYKNLNIEKNTFRKDKYKINGYNLEVDEYDGGLTVYHNNIETEWILNTDWLDRQQILDLEDLWYSKNVFMMIDDEIYKVISLNESQNINNKKSTLRSYTLNVRLSNKKYN